MVVVAERQANQGLSKAIGECEDERVRDFAGEAGGSVGGEPGAGDRPELGVYIVVEDSEIEGLTEETGEETKLSLCSSVCLAFVECLVGVIC